MYKLERCMLRREADIFKLKYAWLTLKTQYSTNPIQPNRNVSFRDANSFKGVKEQTSLGKDSMHSLEIENRELYLEYMGKVLNAKQQELIELEQYLFEHREEAQRQQIKKNVVNPLTLNHQAEMINNKVAALKQLLNKFTGRNVEPGQEFEDFMKSIDVMEIACKKSYNTLTEDIVAQYEQFNRQRNQLSAKLSKLTELESYEKYLNQLQAALQQKEFQLIDKERMELKQTDSHNRAVDVVLEQASNTLSLHNNSQKFSTYGEDKYGINVNQPSMRRRTKIFQNKANNNTLSLPSQSITPTHIQSSKIMQQNSTHNQFLKKEAEPSSQTAKQVNQQSSQTQITEGKEQVVSKLKKDKLCIKFLRLWLKYSDKFTKNTQPTNHKKLMNLYLWRLNALYDENLVHKIQENLAWPRKIAALGDIPLFNYAQLSLRKKKYIQMFFNYEQKRFQRRRIIQALKNVLRSKNRRERTAFVLIFRKYRQHARYLALLSIVPAMKQYSSAELVLADKNSIGGLQNSKVKNKEQGESRLFNLTNSTVDNKLTGSQTKAKSKIIRQSSKNLSTNQASQGPSKTKLSSKQNQASNVDMQKLKEYIKSQEQTETRLAIECAQTESIYRLMSVLTPATYRLRNTFFVNAIRVAQTARMNNLERGISCCEFKWQLFMAKARLSLTNNSNKIAHLEQLISLIGGKGLSSS